MLYKNGQAKSTTISMRMQIETLEHLRHLARQQAVKENRDVSFADLIREAVARLYPLPEHDILSP